MFGYSDFSEDVKNIFDETFTSKYALNLTEQDTSSVIFKSKKCTLIISIDGLIVDATFLEPGFSFLDNEYYSVSLIMEFKHLNCTILIHKNYSRVADSLTQLRNIIETNCLDILENGDFSWKKEFEAFLDKRFNERNR